MFDFKGILNLYSQLEKRYSQNKQLIPKSLFLESKIGLEKESLRVSPSGSISQTPHPATLGSALLHPHITTDYSEALLEFVTPPCQSHEQLLSFLTNCQTFVYEELGDEFLWASSMPCVVSGEPSIPIAEYGKSNLGKMKTVYRRGLGHRYGRMMQVIAGIHFNYSFSPSYWQHFQDICEIRDEHQVFVSESYFNLIRNFQRFGWLIPYLFGASPAVCKSFLNGMETDMAEFNENTYYHPFATSLRMSDIGYQNSKEDKSGIKVNYDDVNRYVESLRHAITTLHQPFAEMGVLVNGEYEQLNANLLQIENEYYSTVRPKQIIQRMEMPINALRSRGVEYIELRSLDIDVFEPCGINDKALYFLESFMMFCLYCDSPPISESEHQQISQNILEVAQRGREPDLALQRGDEKILLKDWANEIFEHMRGAAEILDQNNSEAKFSSSLAYYKTLVDDPDLTPSARMLAEMSQNNEGFFHFSLRKSKEHLAYFKDLDISSEQRQFFRNLSRESIENQRKLEDSDELNFDDFLAQYFKQSMESSNAM